ncbi:MAG: electron transfer flavoprotein subunit beta/FixA family protein [Nocardioidaceae bacterium]
MSADEEVVVRPTLAVLVKDVPLADDATDANGPRGLDPISEVPLEWALRQRAAGRAAAVVAIAMGPPAAAETLRRAVAFGVDDTLLVSDPGLPGSDVRRTARVLAAAVDQVAATVAVCGYESRDGSSGVVPSAIAAVLGWPVLSRAAEATWTDDDVIEVERDVGSGPRRERVAAPVVLSFVEGRIDPRYPVLRDVLRSRRASVPEIALDRLAARGLETTRHERVVRTERIEPPRKEPAYAGPDDGPDAILEILAEQGIVA